VGDPRAFRTDRIAGPWLIRRLIDPGAEIVRVLTAALPAGYDRAVSHGGFP
jgi:hypothetical protein